jgi:hypothetical protein
MIDQNVNIGQFWGKIAGKVECECKMIGQNVNIGQCWGKIAGKFECGCKVICLIPEDSTLRPDMSLCVQKTSLRKPMRQITYLYRYKRAVN